jgi:type IV pilus assembly protein PilB
MLISDVIVELGFVGRERVDEVVNEARVAGRSPESLLREYQVIDGEQLSRAIAERYGLDHVDLNAYKVDMGATNLLSMSAARRYKALPVGYVDKETLLLAMADPANVLAVDDIQMMTDLNCRVAVAAEDIEVLISRMSRLEHAVTDAVQEEEEVEGGGRDHRAPRDGRGRAGHQARPLGPGAGCERGRIGHPLRGRGGRDAGALPC